MLFLSSLVVFVAFSSCRAAQYASRSEIQDYLTSVYFATPNSTWAAMTDQQVFDFYDQLTYYYPNPPKTKSWSTRYPHGRKESHPYASTYCDCLHLDLELCEWNMMNCQYWPTPTYLNMEKVLTFQPLPANVWFEGESYPGEWGFPLSCQDATLGQGVYGYYRRMWLYPVTGTGVWFNTGKTADAPNKVAWLLKYGLNTGLGSTRLEVMDSLAEVVCPGYKNRTNIHCDICTDPGDTTKCCCHGSGYNLGTQVLAAKSRYRLATIDDALDLVAKMHEDAYLGQDRPFSAYPNGTFFSIRDVLDPFIKRIQANNDYDSVQFWREPQHPREAFPAYAFEVLFHPGPSAYTWSRFCKSNGIAVVDPTNDIANYLDQQYVATSATKPLSVWKPRPDFKKLFDTSKKRSIVSTVAMKANPKAHRRF